MRLALLVLAAASVPALAAAPRVHTKPKSASTAVKSHKAVAATPKPAGMSPDRAAQIQSALIKQGYMTGEPTGAWDANSVAAMQKLQSDNGWQTKFTPDSRALIKLGLAGEAANSTVAAQ
jgi:hypothetical protein